MFQSYQKQIDLSMGIQKMKNFVVKIQTTMSLRIAANTKEDAEQIAKDVSLQDEGQAIILNIKEEETCGNPV